MAVSNAAVLVAEDNARGLFQVALRAFTEQIVVDAEIHPSNFA